VNKAQKRGCKDRDDSTNTGASDVGNEGTIDSTNGGRQHGCLTALNSKSLHPVVAHSMTCTGNGANKGRDSSTNGGVNNNANEGGDDSANEGASEVWNGGMNGNTNKGASEGGMARARSEMRAGMMAWTTRNNRGGAPNWGGHCTAKTGLVSISLE
jgi:hypothetical protein